MAIIVFVVICWGGGRPQSSRHRLGRWDWEVVWLVLLILPACVCGSKHGPCADQAPSGVRTRQLARARNYPVWHWSTCDRGLRSIASPHADNDSRSPPMSQGQKVNLYSRVPSSEDGARVFQAIRSKLTRRTTPSTFPPSVSSNSRPRSSKSSNPQTRPSTPPSSTRTNTSSLVIKPSAKGTAILSTPSKSFLLRAVDQSNSLMLFAPSDTDGFHLVHTASEYLEVIPNPARVALDPSIPLWDGEKMDVDVSPELGGS